MPWTVNRGHIDDGNVDQVRLRAIGHRIPRVSPGPRWIHILGRGIPISLPRQDRPSGFHVDVGRPIHVGVVFRREELSGVAIEDVEKAVLRRLHDDPLPRAADGEVRKNQLLHRVVVPTVVRRGLVVPGHAAGGGIESDDGRGEQAVELRRPELAQVIGRGVGSAEVNEVQIGIVGKPIPRGSAAVELRFAMRVPSLVRHRQFGIFIGLSDRRRHGIEAPFEGAGFQIIGRDIAAHGAMPHVGAAIADDHHVARDLRRAGTGVG